MCVCCIAQHYLETSDTGIYMYRLSRLPTPMSTLYFSDNFKLSTNDITPLAYLKCFSVVLQGINPSVLCKN